MSIKPLLVKSRYIFVHYVTKLIYDNCELYIEVLGGVKITGLDRMKVTLKIKHKEKFTQPQWYSLDLYHQVQREQTIQNVAEYLEVSNQQTTTTFINLITELENYRLQKIEALQPKEKQKQELTPAQRTAAIKRIKETQFITAYCRHDSLNRHCWRSQQQHDSVFSVLYKKTKRAIAHYVFRQQRQRQNLFTRKNKRTCTNRRQNRNYPNYRKRTVLF